jgi:hypothetical protein
LHQRLPKCDPRASFTLYAARLALQNIMKQNSCENIKELSRSPHIMAVIYGPMKSGANFFLSSVPTSLLSVSIAQSVSRVDGQCSVWLRAGRQGFDPRQRQKDLLSNLCVQTGFGAHPASCTVGTGVLSPGLNCGRGVTLTTHPHLVPWSRMSKSDTSSPLKRLSGV